MTGLALVLGLLPAGAAAALEIGQVAPDFSLAAATDAKVSLGECGDDLNVISTEVFVGAARELAATR